MNPKIKIKWNQPMDVIAAESTGGKDGMKFLANEAARLMDPYVPADKLILSQNIKITADEDCGHILYDSPYAHYQYEGELYGPNYPITDGENVVGFYSPPHKTPTGKKLHHSTFRHPLATSHWDKAMKTARGDELARSYQDYLNRRKK